MKEHVVFHWRLLLSGQLAFQTRMPMSSRGAEVSELNRRDAMTCIARKVRQHWPGVLTSEQLVARRKIPLGEKT